MQTKRTKPSGVRVGLVISKEAKSIVLGYSSQRTMGEFVSQLIVDYHAKRTRQPTKEEIAQELRRLASLLEEANIDNPYAHNGYQSDTPMPLANIIDSPPGLVGVTVISEEDGEHPKESL
jgi:hypothetical protein